MSTGRPPSAKLSDCEKYIREKSDSTIETVIDVGDEEKFRVVNKDPENPELFERLVFDAADRFNLTVRETGPTDVVYIAVPGA